MRSWYKSLSSDLQPQEPVWTLVRYNDDVHLYDLGSETRINWSTLSPSFMGGPGKRPMRIMVGQDSSEHEPYLYSLIQTRRCDSCAIGRPFQIIYAICMPSIGHQLLSSNSIPDLNLCVIAGR